MLGNGLNSWIYIEIYVIYASVTKKQGFYNLFCFSLFFFQIFAKIWRRKKIFPQNGFKKGLYTREAQKMLLIKFHA